MGFCQVRVAIRSEGISVQQSVQTSAVARFRISVERVKMRVVHIVLFLGLANGLGRSFLQTVSEIRNTRSLQFFLFYGSASTAMVFVVNRSATLYPQSLTPSLAVVAIGTN